MKTTFTSFTVAFAILSQLVSASPLIETRGVLPQLDLLASYGIVKVSDFVPDFPDDGNATASIIAGGGPGGLAPRQSGCTFRAYSADHCESGAGSGISIGPASKCIGTTNRHSFSVTCNAYVSADPNTNCAQGTAGYGGVASSGCYNVNTGFDWRSSFVYTV